MSLKVEFCESTFILISSLSDLIKPTPKYLEILPRNILLVHMNGKIFVRKMNDISYWKMFIDQNKQITRVFLSSQEVVAKMNLPNFCTSTEATFLKSPGI